MSLGALGVPHAAWIVHRLSLAGLHSSQGFVTLTRSIPVQSSNEEADGGMWTTLQKNQTLGIKTLEVLHASFLFLALQLCSTPLPRPTGKSHSKANHSSSPLSLPFYLARPQSPLQSNSNTKSNLAGCRSDNLYTNCSGVDCERGVDGNEIHWWVSGDHGFSNGECSDVWQ